jgi:hypothetical protein
MTNAFFVGRILGFVVGAFVGVGTLINNAYARDYGQYLDSPEHIRNWFKGLNNPRMRECACLAVKKRTVPAPKHEFAAAAGKPRLQTARG